jgi:hypothetical protein
MKKTNEKEQITRRGIFELSSAALATAEFSQVLTQRRPRIPLRLALVNLRAEAELGEDLGYCWWAFLFCDCRNLIGTVAWCTLESLGVERRLDHPALPLPKFPFAHHEAAAQQEGNAFDELPFYVVPGILNEHVMRELEIPGDVGVGPIQRGGSARPCVWRGRHQSSERRRLRDS